MAKIVITYHPRWTDGMPSWAASKYSPNLTNSQKIQANLEKLGSINRLEWQQNMQLISNAIVPAVLGNNLHIHIEKLTLAGSCIVLSMTMNVSKQSKFFCGFVLSSILNLDSIYFVEKILNTKSSFTADGKASISTKKPIRYYANNNHNQEPQYANEDTENIENWRNTYIKNKDSEEDDDTDDEKFLYALALKEPPKVTADKALSNGLEWYSFFLPKQNEEDTLQNDNPVVVNASSPAFIQKINK